MFKTIKYTNIFLKNIIASGTTTLYHMNKHGPGFPNPLRPLYNKNFFRPWMKESPDSAIWLTPKWELVYNFQLRNLGSVHVFEVDNGIIAEAGGIHIYDKAPEIIISKEIWEQGLKEGKIKYKGKMNENKQHQRQQQTNQIRTNQISSGVDDPINDKLSTFVLKLHGTPLGDFIKNKIQIFNHFNKKDKLIQLLDELERGVEPTIVTEEKEKL